MIVRQDVLWCPMFQVKTHPASAYVFMPVRLLDFSSPAVSTPRGIISGQSGTPDCRPPCLVKLLIYQIPTTIISITDNDYVYSGAHCSPVQLIYHLDQEQFLFLFVRYRDQRTSHSTLQ